LSLYIDTSALVAYYPPEPASARVQTILQASPDLTISELVHLELYAALMIKVRVNTLLPQDAQKVIALFEEHLSAGYYTVTTLTQQHYYKARKLVNHPTLAIKAPDALPLASVMLEKHDLLTLDAQLARNATQVNAKVVAV
jgi:predicted nucleic acid-binding protein